MYPNPQDALALPPRPDLGQFRKRAKSLARACREAKPDALLDAVRAWIDSLAAVLPPEQMSTDHRRRAQTVEQVAMYARAQLGEECSLTRAQFVFARVHGFRSWPKLLQHIGGGARPASVEAFEQAAEAIGEGRIDDLRALLDANPSLIRAHSTREHEATLLHYVSANGVENYRQKTPDNIIAIARLLLDRGAEAEATAEVYGGGARTLGLVLTSAHPRAKNLQIPLAELLLEHGARVTPGLIRDCFANGCPEAAEWLAMQGAPVDLEEAAGLGDLGRIRALLHEATRDEQVKALMMAAWHGKLESIRTLFDGGLPVGVQEEPGRQGHTALHIAAYAGNVELVDYLLGRGSPAALPDDYYGTSPLGWAMYAWLEEHEGRSDAHREVVKRLIHAGAPVQDDWLKDDRLSNEPEIRELMVDDNAATGG